MLRPASQGNQVIAGGSVLVLELAGIKIFWQNNLDQTIFK
jgi:ribosomal protein S5